MYWDHSTDGEVEDAYYSVVNGIRSLVLAGEPVDDLFVALCDAAQRLGDELLKRDVPIDTLTYDVDFEWDEAVA